MMIYPIIIIILLILVLILIYQNSKNVNIENYNYTPNELFQHLNFISTILTNNNIKHWLTYGTLLGSVREQDIIPYDYDFDLGANVDDIDKILSLNANLDYYGYMLQKPFVYDEKSKKNVWKVSLKIYFKGIPMGDIYLYKKFNDGFMRRYDPITGTYFWPKGTFPYYFVDDLDIGKVKNAYFPIPRDSETLLEYYYGKTWKIPIKARAQGGIGDSNSDYYGGSNIVKLSSLIDHVKNKGIIISPNIDKKVNYILPEDQVLWTKTNEK